MTSLIPRESVEFQPVEVRLDGVLVTTAVEFCVTTARARPETWIAPVVLGDAIGVMVDGLDPGTYVVWGRVTDYPEQPVLDCGQIRIT